MRKERARQKELHEKYGTAEAWYNNNETYRNGLEGDWRDSSQLTLPYLAPPEEGSESKTLPTPYNSIGSAAVNSLASKLLLALLPPTGVFFRLLPNIELVSELSKQEITSLETELAGLERDVVEYINQEALRVPVYEAIKLLVVTGNTMLYKVPKGGIKVFSPYHYVVQRDYVGNMLTSCIKETMNFKTLPTKVQIQIEDELKEQVGESTVDTSDSKEALKDVDVYTMVVRGGPNKYIVWQETKGIIINNTIKEYTKDNLPYLVLRWSTINNENYGRGIVSQYLGDLRSLEGLTQTITEGAEVSAFTLFGLRPGSALHVEDLNNAKNGDFVEGDLEREISKLRVDKAADYQVAMTLMNQIEQRVARAFLMMSGQVRDSERTTATEVRAVAAELEATLGGVFSVLANEFQTPLISLILREIAPKVLNVAKPSITTGISAISRERDYNNLNTMLMSIGQLGPEVIAQYLDIPAYLTQVATSLGMDPASIVKSPEQIQQEKEAMQQAQQQQMLVETAKDMAVEQSKKGD